ncbi:TonB-dependent receptor [Pedobacter changchengzhani]|uniref:TonB-dependent receptor n=1 Tax=Pedobacter changchengzhani TaxID=2529274 RepID=A0A4V3A054_9SPHI|nr:TonB-dependent receptor [Pedobacter changchengzhani]TDG36293.1 TonB-dependent receptor [Pedobacter changchengzhani]
MKKKLLRNFCAVLLTLLCVTLINENLRAQDKIITGKVTDADGGGVLPGVTVKVKGTTLGAITDANGNYSIKVNEKSRVLVFNFIGYEEIEKFVPDDNSIVNVKLTSSSQGLNEVVVVAYGAQKKETVTGAISSISTKEIKQSPAANLAVSLAGRLPGLSALQRSGEPGRDLTQIFVRGQGTTNTQSPIVLVDGVERELTFIDPNEVESVTVLKDASSTAIFGVRGANGVILVTTKRGTSEVPEINFTAETGGQDFTRLAQPVNSFQYATLKNLASANDGLPPVYSDAALAAYQSGSDPIRYPNTDWVNTLVRKFSPESRYNLNISGAGKAVRYFVNAGVLNQSGSFKTEKDLNYDPSFKLNRYNFRSNIDLQINKSLKAYLNIAGYLEKQNGPFGVAIASTGQGGDSPSLYVLANLFDLPATIPGPLTPDGSVSTNSTIINVPYGLLNRSGYRQQTRSNVTATYGMEQNLDFVTKGLTAKALISFDTKSTNNLNASRSFVKQVQFIDPNNLGPDGLPVVSYKPFNADVNTPLAISGSGNFTSLANFQGFLNYNRIFGKHTVTGLVLYQQQQTIIDSQLPFNLLGVSNRLTYGYDNRYFAEFNAGYNGSEQFAKGKRFGFFPAFSGAWVVSNEKFWNVKGINSLKIRGSYGEVGNDRINSKRFIYSDDITVVGGGYSSTLGGGNRVNYNQIGNPDLQWEVAKKANIGLEIGFLKSFNLVADIFSENRDNVLIPRGTIPVLNGLPVGILPPVNIGVVNNKGYELELNYKKYFDKDFSIVSRVNVSYATNKLKFADEAQLSSDYAYRYRKTGYSIGQNFGYIVDKYFDNQAEIDQSPVQSIGANASKPGDFKYKDLNGDGIIDPKDLAPIGYSSVPEYTFGAAFSITYKGFDLSLLFQGVTNVSNYYQSRGTFPGSNYYVNHLESWTAERAAAGDPINYPRLTTKTSPNENRNSFFILDASYIRLKNAEIGYTLPLSISKRIGSKRVRLYANGLNLYTWDKLPSKQFDPELTGELSYPVLRIINFGANVAF